MNWLEKLLRRDKIAVDQDKSIMERLELLIPNVVEIRDLYNVDRTLAEVASEALLAVTKLLKETDRALAKAMARQQQAVAAQGLLLEQQEITGDAIDIQSAKQLDVETIAQNFREWLIRDDLTIAWMLDNVVVPAFARAWAMQSERRQRLLFNTLSVAVNQLKKLDGILLEPGA